MNSCNIQTDKRFSSLFPIWPDILKAITEHMRSYGYDPAQPLTLATGPWNGESPVVIDGHTRLKAAIRVGIEEIPVHVRKFKTEQEALEWAIHNQRNRRNLSDAELVALIEAHDSRLRQGGDRRSELFKGSSEPMKGKRSAEATAEKLGTSATKVKKVRTILDHGSDQVKEDVKADRKSVNKAYEETQARRKAEQETSSTDKPDHSQESSVNPKSHGEVESDISDEIAAFQNEVEQLTMCLFQCLFFAGECGLPWEHVQPADRATFKEALEEFLKEFLPILWNLAPIIEWGPRGTFFTEHDAENYRERYEKAIQMGRKIFDEPTDRSEE